MGFTVFKLVFVSITHSAGIIPIFPYIHAFYQAKAIRQHFFSFIYQYMIEHARADSGGSWGATGPPPLASCLMLFFCFRILQYFLPARASEQGNVIGSVRIYICVCTKKIVIERTRDLIYLKFVATDFFRK